WRVSSAVGQMGRRHRDGAEVLRQHEPRSWPCRRSECVDHLDLIEVVRKVASIRSDGWCWFGLAGTRLQVLDGDLGDELRTWTAARPGGMTVQISGGCGR